MDREYVARAAGERGAVARGTSSETTRRGEARDVQLARTVLDRELAQSQAEKVQLQQQLSAFAEEREQARAAARLAVNESAAKRKQLEDDLEIARERIKALEADLAARNADAKTIRGEVDSLEKELSEAKAEIVRLQEESALHRKNYDETQAKLLTAEPIALRVEPLERDLAATREKLAVAEQRGETLQKETETLRREFAQTDFGRELIDLRSQLGEARKEQEKLGGQLTEARREVRRLADAESELRLNFDAMRSARDEALIRAEAGSQSALQHGNEVLRGILDRQKIELDERYVELRRLKKAQFASRILYAIFGIGLIGVIALALHLVPQILH